MAEQMTKSQLIEKIAEESELAKKDVKGVLESLASGTPDHSSASPPEHSWLPE